jgi:anti-anti-sigma factor
MKSGQIFDAYEGGVYVLKLVGDVRLTLSLTLEGCIRKALQKHETQQVVVDLTEAEGIDSTTLGLLAKLSLLAKQQFGWEPVLVYDSPDIYHLLESVGFVEQVFHPVRQRDLVKAPLQAVETLECDAATLKQQVLDAHRVLMSLNVANSESFRDLVCALEEQS